MYRSSGGCAVRSVRSTPSKLMRTSNMSGSICDRICAWRRSSINIVSPRPRKVTSAASRQSSCWGCRSRSSAANGRSSGERPHASAIASRAWWCSRGTRPVRSVSERCSSCSSRRRACFSHASRLIRSLSSPSCSARLSSHSANARPVAWSSSYTSLVVGSTPNARIRSSNLTRSLAIWAQAASVRSSCAFSASTASPPFSRRCFSASINRCLVSATVLSAASRAC
jgi:hypothetical protein